MTTTSRRGVFVAVAALALLVVLVLSPASRATVAPPAMQHTASTAWLDRLNAWRISTGLPTLTENATWSSGDYAHALYMVKNDLVTHYETVGTPYYTAAGDTAARNSNIYVSSSTATTDTQAIDWWMQAPFHALGLMDPRLTSTGFGSYREVKSGWQLGAAVDVLRGNSFTGGRYPVFFPGNGAAVPLTSYGGNESPDPLQACPGYAPPTGLPVFIQVGGNVATTAGAAHSFTGNGTALAHCVIDSSAANVGASLKSRGAVVLIPRQPLKTGVQYTVALTVNGKPYSWSFTIGSFSACTTVAVSAAPAVPATTVTITAAAAGCPNPNPLYHFGIMGPGQSTYTTVEDYSTSPTYTWNTVGLVPGTYRFSVWARDANSTGLFGNAAGRWDAYNNNFTYGLDSCSGLTVTALATSPKAIGTAIDLNAHSTGCANPLYHFSVMAPGQTSYAQLQDYSTSATLHWATAGLVPGSYRFSVWVRDANSVGAEGNSAGRWDAYNNNLTFTLTSCSSLSLVVSPASSSPAGTSVTLTATAAGCPLPLYHFGVMAPGQTTYAILRDYSSSLTFTWNTTGLATGTYRFSVWARDTNSAGATGNSAGTWDTYNNGTTYVLS